MIENARFGLLLKNARVFDGTGGPWFQADLVVFDPDRVIDTSTYDDPRRYPEGILHVFVNGRHAVKNGHLLEANAGGVLRRGG